MSEKPILFSTPMVQAILDGCKTQTRRIVKPQPSSIRQSPFAKSGIEDNHGREIKPQYNVGDILWVRETYAILGNDDGQAINWDDEPCNDITKAALIYRASCIQKPNNYGLWSIPNTDMQYEGNWMPSIYMPKFAARIWLEVTNVRVERLQDISGQDAISEGIEKDSVTVSYRIYPPKGMWTGSPVISFQTLWDQINDKDKSKSWEANPYVWVYEFKRINKDAL